MLHAECHSGHFSWDKLALIIISVIFQLKIVQVNIISKLEFTEPLS